jgi:hypothetical protein
MDAFLARVALSVCLFAVPPVALAGGDFNGFDVRGALVPAERIERGGPPRDGIPAIDRPRFVAAAQAKLQPDDRVLGLVRGGETRAYPIRILNWHEVVNDRFDADPIAVTYCPLCGTGMAFIARDRGQELNFGVSGLLYNSDVLLYDRATESLWSQVKQQAISGPRKGRMLEIVPLEHTTWADWHARYPQTKVLSTETGYARDYDRDPYAGYDRVPRLLFDVEHRDERLPLKEWVLGVTVASSGGTVRKAYPFSALERALGSARQGRVRDRVGGRDIEIRFDRSHRTAQAYDAKGQALPSVMGFWFAWIAFYPGTQVYAPQ